MIVVNQDGATAQFFNYDRTDQVAQESRNHAVTIIDGPKYVAPPTPQPTPPTASNRTHKLEQRPPNKPPINHNPDKHGKPKYVEPSRVYYGQIQNLPPLRHHYQKPLKLQQQPNTAYKYHKVVPLQPNRNHLYNKQQSLVFAASSSKPQYVPKSPKFSLPVETINGIRAEFVRPPHFANTTVAATTTTTTTAATTLTTKYLRTKRIWPKRVLEKMNVVNKNNTSSDNSTKGELQSSSSNQRFIYVSKPDGLTTTLEPTTRRYQRVTRVSKKRASSTPAPSNFSTFAPNDWVPIVPSHFTVKKVRKSKLIPINRRKDVMQRRSDVLFYKPTENLAPSKRVYYLQSFGLLPVANPKKYENSPKPSSSARKNIIYLGKSKKLKPHVYSGSRGKPVLHTSQVIGDYQSNESHPPKMVTRIKHHHHHHHHRYVKTVDKPVRVEVPKPVPVPVPVPMPVKVEHRVPYPVPVQVPHPVPVKVVEKEYVPKPYPVFQQVPVLKHIQVKVPQPVPVEVEKRVPVPYKVEVAVPQPFPVAVPVEKRVPYPVAVRVLVPQPVAVETRVPYPVQVPVKEQVEVIRHVPVKVPYPQPYPVKVPQPVPYAVEKKVPYPVEVEKKIPLPIPFRVPVHHKVEVEKKVPIYIPKPYPVEKKVPVPVKIPYPVRIPFRVPVGIPIFVHPDPVNNDGEHVVTSHFSVEDNEGLTTTPKQESHYAYSVNSNTVTNSPVITTTRQQTHYAFPLNDKIVTNSPVITTTRQQSHYTYPLSSKTLINSLGITTSPRQHSYYAYSVNGNTVASTPANTVPIHDNTRSLHGNTISVHGNTATEPAHQTVTFHGNTVATSPHHTVTVHGSTRGNTKFNGFQARSDLVEDTTQPYSEASTAISLSTKSLTENSDITTIASNTATTDTETILKDSSKDSWLLQLFDSSTSDAETTGTINAAVSTITLDPR